MRPGSHLPWTLPSGRKALNARSRMTTAASPSWGTRWSPQTVSCSISTASPGRHRRRGRQEDGSPVFGILEDRRGALFFATAAGLLQFQDGQWREFDWPDGARPRGAASLFELADGRVVIGVAGGA